MTRGEHILWQWGFLSLTLEGVFLALKMCIRLVLLIIGSSVLTLTTTPIQLTDGIEFMLRPFKKIGVPAHEIAMMMTIALRFIPTLLDETDKIMKAQQARGADFDTGNLMQKAKSLIPILVPLFISAFRRAEELAMAMEARCYHGDENRTRMNRMIMQRRDYRALVIGLVYIVAILGLRYLPHLFPFII
jgi:energy-coupling factor transport system permease protein